MSSKKKCAPLNRGIIFDKIDPRDFAKIDFMYCCEQCSFFIAENEGCNMGYNTKNHLKANQLKAYELHGRMCFCRNHEID
ncbi:MAG: hypothetical protein HOO06_01335 [Bdellovibrionaceae bacterium]|nr:hypothetical protein [Pseudobdellovibrionaceae bacterium]